VNLAAGFGDVFPELPAELVGATERGAVGSNERSNAAGSVLEGTRVHDPARRARPQDVHLRGLDVVTDAKERERQYTIPEPQTAQEVIGFYARRIAEDVKPAVFTGSRRPARSRRSGSMKAT
jgi:hypothetical protein